MLDLKKMEEEASINNNDAEDPDASPDVNEVDVDEFVPDLENAIDDPDDIEEFLTTRLLFTREMIDVVRIFGLSWLPCWAHLLQLPIGHAFAPKCKVFTFLSYLLFNLL